MEHVLMEDEAFFSFRGVGTFEAESFFLWLFIPKGL